MKTKKKKLNIKKIIFLLILIILIYKFKTSFIDTSISQKGNTYNFFSNSKYEIIKEDENPNYNGIGQENVSDKDGYFTTFTTSNDNKKTYIEYKQNGSSSWANSKYWGGTMEENGCGITTIAIILSGYNKNYTPNDLREKYFPLLNSEKISNELSRTFGIKNSDFYFDSPHLSEDKLTEHLKTNRPIIVCVWNNPNSNRWTTSSHYMALLACDDNGKVYISNPNGLKDTEKSSGWYNFNEITPYIAKALYIEDYN